MLPRLGKIRYLTIHCSGSPAGRGNTPVDVKRWDMERFGQPSYHHVIPENGPAVRHLTDEQLGCHVAKHNTGNIGVCYIGGCDKAMKPHDTRTQSQRSELRRIVSEYKAKFPGLIVRGHRDWAGVTKACPCFDVASEL